MRLEMTTAAAVVIENYLSVRLSAGCFQVCGERYAGR